MILPSVIKDRFLGVEYYGVFQFYDIPIPVPVVVINPYYTTLIELRTKEGGLKKRWFYNQDTDNPIESISVEQTEKGFGICKVIFADLMYPVEASDLIKIYFGGNAIYEGIVDNDVDITDPVMTASPFWKLLSEVLYTGTHGTGTSVKVILQDVIEDMQADTGIAWNTAKVDVGISPPLLEVSYDREVASAVIDKMVEYAGSTYYWGVDYEREFFVKKYDRTGIPVYNFYSTDEADFSAVSIKEDYGKVEMTEAVVYKKSDTDPEAVYVGSVGNTGNVTYPPIDVSYRIRRKVGKITASEVLTNTTALDWAYEVLKKQGTELETVKISKINLENYFPVVGDRVLAEDDYKRTMFTAIDCATDDNWTNVTESAGEGLNGTDALKLFASGASNNSIYNYQRPIQYYKQEKVGFYIKAPVDTVMEVAFSLNTPAGANEWFKFAVSDNNIYTYIDFDYKLPFQYIHFKYVAGNIYLDNIQIFCEHKRQITSTVKKVSLKWDSTGINCDIDCGDITNPETRQMGKMTRKVQILEAINNI